MPIGHADGLLGASEEQLRDVIAGVRAVANGMRTALGSTGTCVLQASGPDSGGSVRHLHMHVVPCWEDDGVVFWPEQVSVHRIPVTREGASAHDLIAAELNIGSRRARTTDVG